MSNIDKHAVQAVADLKAGYTLGHADVAILKELARIALASLEVEAVAYADPQSFDNFKSMGGKNAACTKEWMWRDSGDGLIPVYTAPPAPVSVPDELTREEYKRRFMEDDDFDDTFRGGWNACRAAMLHGSDTELQRKAAIHDALCEKYNVESLTDFVDWQRNHIAELEAAPPAPVGPGETAVMPDYPGYTMTQRECFQAGKKAGLAEAGNSPVIQDGWVACSERLPETDGNYWGWWSESKRQGPVWFIKSELQAQFQSSEITHWMPLPAAPQQK
ncbi:DUF551 domain-containing protein [Enterobacter hormaechei]